MSNYTTGEVAKICNVSVRTVQFYDTKGVMHPSDLTEGGRRLYNDDDIQKFQIVCVLRDIGLSLNSIKSIFENEFSEKILTLLLNEQMNLLTTEIAERQKQVEMINVIKEKLSDKTIIPVNTILGIDNIMENKKNYLNKKNLTLIYIGVGVASTLGLLFMVWLIVSQIWWGLAIYVFFAIFGLFISALQFKDTEFVCPKCDSIFKPPLRRAFFSTGSHKVRWINCPVCGQKEWCVLRKEIAEKSIT